MKEKSWPMPLPGSQSASYEQGRLLKLVWVILIVLLMALFMSGCSAVSDLPTF